VTFYSKYEDFQIPVLDTSWFYSVFPDRLFFNADHAADAGRTKIGPWSPFPVSGLW
jgi:hypothetical protein